MGITRYVMLSISILILFKAKMELAILINLYIYTIALWYGYMYTKYDIINNLMFCTYLVMSFLYYLVGLEDILPYLGTIINFNFILLTFYFIYTKRTITYTPNANLTNMEYKAILYTNIYAIVLYLMANIISFILKPNILYIIIPIVLVVLGIVLMDKIRLYILKLMLKQQEDLHRKRNIKDIDMNIFTNQDGFINSYKNGKYIFKEVTNKNELEEFNFILKKAYTQHLIQSKSISKNSFYDSITINDLDIYSKCYLLYLNDKKPIATVKVSLRGVDGKLPLEKTTIPENLELPNLDSHLKYAEYGKLAVLPQYRNSDVLEILFKGSIYFIIEKNISIVYCDAYKNISKLYEKLGFNPLHEGTFLDSDTFPCKIYYKNISNTVYSIKSQYTIDQQSKDLIFYKINTYLNNLKNIKIDGKQIYKVTDLSLQLEKQ